jgi:hypothetical protein
LHNDNDRVNNNSTRSSNNNDNDNDNDNGKGTATAAPGAATTTTTTTTTARNTSVAILDQGLVPPWYFPDAWHFLKTKPRPIDLSWFLSAMACSKPAPAVQPAALNPHVSGKIAKDVVESMNGGCIRPPPGPT